MRLSDPTGTDYVWDKLASGRLRRRRVFGRICERCEADFKTLKPTVRFCSPSCRGAAISPLLPQNQIRQIDKICEVCSKPFSVYAGRSKTAKYCSRRCFHGSKKIKFGKGLSSVRKQCKERDNFRCRICGFGEIIHSHHIIPKLQGGKHVIENLITLCPNHHALVHAGFLTISQLIEILNEPLPQREMKLTSKTHSLYYRRRIG